MKPRTDLALLVLPRRNAAPIIALSCIRKGKLRMPIFPYFLVVGSVLTGLLLWFGNGSEPTGPTLTSSQTVGIPRFRPEPEAEHARATAVNFAAEYKRAERKPVKTAETPPRQKAELFKAAAIELFCRIPARQSEHSLIKRQKSPPSRSVRRAFCFRAVG